MAKNLTIFRGAFLFSLCWILAAAACHRSQENRAALLPASNEIAGWVRTGDIRTFQAADLWKYIDGDAERYLKSGVRSVSTADYRFRDRVDATVDIYAMATPAGAREIFESEPIGDAKPIQLGDNARQYGQSLVLRKGLLFLRITAYQNSEETQPALLALGSGIERRLTR